MSILISSPHLSLSYATPTNVIEHALHHARLGAKVCAHCPGQPPIGPIELDLALDSRLVNALGLIEAARRSDQSQIVLQRTIQALRCLVEDAMHLRIVRLEHGDDGAVNH
ncbi:hypothetical protein [Dyella sp.]|uniref:hypothetical protein n=1 Tax=Dyella sp. TaxID=1869338 RepID=UPI002ED1A807